MKITQSTHLFPILLMCSWLAGTSQLFAAPPDIINYQGQVSTGSVPVTNPSGQFKFALVDAADTVTYWSNDGTSVNGSEPTGAVSIPVNAGLFSVGLGDTSIPNMTSGIAASVVADNTPVHVKVWFDDGVNGFQALSPTLPLTSVPYALHATSVPAGSITSLELADGAVTNIKLAAGAVSSTNIAAGSITATQLAAGSVGTAALANSAITADKILAVDVQSGSISSTDPGWPSVAFSPAYTATPVVSLSFGLLGEISPNGFSTDANYIKVLDSTGDSGLFNSMTLINGKPAVGYMDSGFTLTYVIASNAEGSSWETPVSIDPVAGYGSLATVNGKPAMSYNDLNNADLKFVIANDINGSSWGVPVTIDSAGSVGQYASLAVVNGKPAISYWDVTNNDLKYVISNNADGSSWGAPITVDSAGSVGQFTSLAVVNNRPAISYFDNSANVLKYVIANDVDGSTWPAPILVDSGNVNFHTSLKVVNGKPAISYQAGNLDLKFVIAGDISGSIWNTPIIVESTGNAGIATSLAVINGKPAISYIYEDIPTTQQSLQFVIANDADGTTWGTPATLTNVGTSGAQTSLLLVNEKPAIAYRDGLNPGLKYIVGSDADGTSWNTVFWTAQKPIDIAVASAANATTASYLGRLSENDVVQNGAVNSVGSAMIIDGSVTSADLADNYLLSSGGTMTGPFTMFTDDLAISDMSLVGTSQGTGRVYVGQSFSYGGGILYKGSNANQPSLVGNQDYVTFYRRDNGVDTEVMSYFYSSDNIRMHGRLENDCTIESTPTKNSGCFRLGNTNGAYLTMDSNEISARTGSGSSSVAATLHLQPDGGDVYVNGAIVHASDVNMKRDFESIDSHQVLDKLAALPISAWTYKFDGKGTRHIGPTSQDFKAAFGLGKSDRHIATVDADGIALTAIKALREEKDTQISELKSMLADKDTVLTEQQKQLTLLEQELVLLKQALFRIEQRLGQGRHPAP